MKKERGGQMLPGGVAGVGAGGGGVLVSSEATSWGAREQATTTGRYAWCWRARLWVLEGKVR